MQSIIKQINRIEGVRGCVLAGDDGLVIASEVANTEDTSPLGAVASSVSTSLASIVDRLKQGTLSRFVMSGTAGSVILVPINDAILLTLVRKDANMGMILVELKQAISELTAALSK